MTDVASRTTAKPKPESLHDIDINLTRAPEPKGPRLSALWSGAQARRDWRKHWVDDTVTGVANVALHQVMRLLPPGWCSDIGAEIGPFVQRLYDKQFMGNRIRRNLALLTGDADPRLWWQNTGRVHAEFAAIDKLWAHGRITVQGEDHLTALREKGQRYIVASVHLGTWEGLALILQQQFGVPVLAPYQPQPNRFINRLIFRLRRGRGLIGLPPGQRSALLLHRLISSGAATGYIMVDEVRDGLTHFPLFGRKPPDRGNAVLAVKLAQAAQAVILPVVLLRQSGCTFALHFLPPVTPGSDGVTPALIRLNAVLEPIVRDHTDQWYMLTSLDVPKAAQTAKPG
ncbi:MAG: lysophospholipid acyltransferase family protein [Pseudomonadota bacterium]